MIAPAASLLDSMPLFSTSVLRSPAILDRKTHSTTYMMSTPLMMRILFDFDPQLNADTLANG